MPSASSSSTSLSSSSASSSLSMLSLMSTSSVPPRLLEIPQIKNELANNSSETDSQAAEVQLIACCLEGCMRLIDFQIAGTQLIAFCLEGCLTLLMESRHWFLLLHSTQRSVTLSLNGRLTDASMGCGMQIQPARINTKSAPTSSETSLMVTVLWER